MRYNLFVRRIAIRTHETYGDVFKVLFVGLLVNPRVHDLHTFGLQQVELFLGQVRAHGRGMRLDLALAQLSSFVPLRLRGSLTGSDGFSYSKRLHLLPTQRSFDQ